MSYSTVKASRMRAKFLLIVLLVVMISLEKPAPVNALFGWFEPKPPQYEICGKTYVCMAAGAGAGLAVVPGFGWLVGMAAVGPVSGGLVANSMGPAVTSGSAVALVQSFMMTVGPGTYVALGTTGAATFAAMCMCQV